MGLLTTWLEADVDQAVREPRTMALATSDARGRTSSRIVAPTKVPDTGIEGSPEMRRAVTEGQMVLTRGTSTMAALRKYSLELRERAVRTYRPSDPHRARRAAQGERPAQACE
jgi:hypothetical protein